MVKVTVGHVLVSSYTTGATGSICSMQEDTTTTITPVMSSVSCSKVCSNSIVRHTYNPMLFDLYIQSGSKSKPTLNCQ